MKKTVAALIFAASLPMLASASNDPHDVYGLWRLSTGAVDVRVADCGDGTPCGTMVRVESDQANDPVDQFNPDPDLRARPLVGLTMLSGFERASNRWKQGTIYNARNGKSYRSTIKLKQDGTLQVKGCVGPICRTQVWTRIE